MTLHEEDFCPVCGGLLLWTKQKKTHCPECERRRDIEAKYGPHHKN